MTQLVPCPPRSAGELKRKNWNRRYPIYLAWAGNATSEQQIHRFASINKDMIDASVMAA
jgi:hypothetical protein